MTIFDAIILNDTTIKVRNDTDWYLDKWLYTDYGFELWYRPIRGMTGVFWDEILDKYEFPDNRWVDRSYRPFIYLESRITEIDLEDMLLTSFVLNFASGEQLYSVMFDKTNMTILISNSISFWDYL